MKSVTMQTIADNLGISRSLVSRALSDDYGVNPKTKSLIEHEAKKLGYTPLHFKKKNRAGIPSLLVLMPRYTLLDTMFGTKVLESIERLTREASISLVLHLFNNHDNSINIPLLESNNNIMGALILSLSKTPIREPLLTLLQKENIPVVLLDPLDQVNNYDIVMADNYMSMYQLTEYVINKGHRRLLFVGHPHISTSFLNRYRGCADCVDRHPEVHCDYILSYHETHPMNVDEFNEYMLDWPNNQRSAIICANDPCALLVYEKLTALGIRIPQDISVVGFDNVQKSINIHPALTTVDISTDTLVKEALQLLQSRNGAADTQANHRLILVGAPIIERQSVREIIEKETVSGEG